MRGPRPAPCTFPEYFLQAAREMVRRRTAAIRDVQRSQLALVLHDHPTWSADEAAEWVGLSARQVQRWRRRWVAGDFSIGRGLQDLLQRAVLPQEIRRRLRSDRRDAREANTSLTTIAQCCPSSWRTNWQRTSWSTSVQRSSRQPICQ